MRLTYYIAIATLLLPMINSVLNFGIETNLQLPLDSRTAPYPHELDVDASLSNASL